MRRLPLLALAAVFLGGGVAEAATAQTVLVRVLRDETSDPVRGAIAHLIDGAGRVVRSALTDAEGRALFPSTPAGRYRARAEMIGMTTAESEPFDAFVGASTIRDLRLAPLPLSLATLDVRAARRACTPRPAEEGRTLATVWDEARKALTAAALTEAQDLYRYETMVFQRDELDDGAIDAREERQQGIRRVPFETLEPADLAELGFVRLVGTDLVYYAPDAAVLLSDEFTDTHCFRLVDDPGAAGLVGIGFEPLERRRGVTDIEGTLWLDRATAELRWLDYGYVDLNLPVRADAGGQVTFERTPSGRWIVPDWWIEMPILGGRELGDGSRRAELRGTRRSGGRVLEVVEGGGRAVGGLALGPGPRGGIEGIVVDSAAVPVAGATVGVVGWNREVFTDSLGAFALIGLGAGSYELRYVDPRWAAFGLVPPVVERRVLAGEVSYIELYLPTLRELLREACRGRAVGGGATLAGRVEDAQGRPLADAAVRATWAAAGSDGGSSAITVRRAVEADGTFLLCDLPRGPSIEVATVVAGREGRAVSISIGPEEAGAVRALTHDDLPR